MKLGILFSGGKDSCYASYLAKKAGYKIECLISIVAKNKESFMFHTPSINGALKQAEVMKIPVIKQETQGEKEKELKDLKNAIKKAIKTYNIQGIVTGAVESVYQASRIQKICNRLGIECFNPLWQKDSEEHWQEIFDLGFKIILVGVSAEGLGKEWLGKEINQENFEELKKLSKKHSFHLAFEGGEAETLVLNCPLFSRKLEIKEKKISGEGNSWRLEAELE
jgi:asparagine synthase (glutamine-hydrolysing)